MLLKQNRKMVAESYGRICRNFVCLRGMSERHPKRHAMLERIKDKRLSINENPRLVVFGFDDAQKKGKDWKPHRQKLDQTLGRERVLLKGKSKKFRRGISS